MGDEILGPVWSAIAEGRAATGRLEGKLEEVATQQKRAEDWVGNKLNSMDSKMDSVRGTLDQIAGGAKASRFLIAAGSTVLGIIGSTVAFIVLHFVILAK